MSTKRSRKTDELKININWNSLKTTKDKMKDKIAKKQRKT